MLQFKRRRQIVYKKYSFYLSNFSQIDEKIFFFEFWRKKNIN